jgi:pilus assembly protein CpaF
MNSAPSFGRRVIPSEGRSLTLVAGTPQAGVRSLPSRDDLKERVRTILMSRIDPVVANNMSRQRLQADVKLLVSAIATEEKIQLNEVEEAALATELTDDMIGLGPLEPLLADDEITDILVNGPYDIYAERHGKLEKTEARFRDSAHVNHVAQRIASAVGRRIDEASPMVDARLADGSRVNIVVPPLCLNGGTISIRKFPKQNITLEQMVQQRNLSPEMARFLDIAAQCRVNILISGGTGSGKTTMLNALSKLIDPGERVLTIEDAAELRLQQPHWLPLETRPPNLEGQGAISIRDLVINALRMRPDRIILGEIRGSECFDLLAAMNTGHDGSMATLHSNSPRECLARMENMVMMSDIKVPKEAISRQIADSVDLIVQVKRLRDGSRRTTNITEVIGMEGEVIVTQELFKFEYLDETADGKIVGEYRSMGLRPYTLEKAKQFGFDQPYLEACL